MQQAWMGVSVGRANEPEGPVSVLKSMGLTISVEMSDISVQIFKMSVEIIVN